MSGNQDFVIENGVLRDYKGPGGDVTIPEGVTEIERWAFDGCTGLTSVTIPEGVTEIGYRAFYGCTGLTSVTIPEGVTKIGESAFEGCTGLTSVTIPAGVTEIGGGAFYDCTGLTSVTIPAGVKEIGSEAFKGCHKLADAQGMVVFRGILFDYTGPGGDVTIPAGVTEISGGAFEDCTGLTSIALPRSIRKIEIAYGDEKLYKTMPEGLFQTADKLNADFVTLINEVWRKQMTPKDWAGLYLFQTAKYFRELCKHRMKKVPADECLSAMLELLAGCKKGSAYLQAANFVIERLKEVSPEHVQTLYEMAAAKKSFQKAADILKPLVSAKEKKAAFAFLADTFQEEQLLKHYEEQKGILKWLGKVLLADGSGKKAPKLAVLTAVMPYADLYSKPTPANRYTKTEVQFLSESDKAAALLDHGSLMGLLWENAKTLNSLSWLLPYCRFANGKEIQSLLSKSKDWGDWYTYNKQGRDAQDFLDGYALMLSDTREAMLYLDKIGVSRALDGYAKLRGTDAETLRDTVLAEFGLDKDGKKVYDLEGNTVTVSLAQDLTLRIFDANAGKVVKSIPKKGADEAKHAAAKADFAEMKKNVKKVVKARVDRLFARFLSGEFRDGEAWQKSYLNNPLLRQVASLLVWSQDGQTFTLRDGAAIDSGEQSYSISDRPIQVAHPMEMRPEDVAAWQRYFNNHGIKQPFAQVWEPVIRPETVKEDRYNGIQIPAYHFKGQEKHGISFDFQYGVSELYIGFSGCDLEYDPWGGAVSRHMLDLNGLLTLGKFTFQKYTRQVNHIVSLLDKWTIYGRILKDDVSVVTMLDSATLAQVMQYLNLAIDNGKVNVTAELLNYKNERFPDFDPLAEFTLDDL